MHTTLIKFYILRQTTYNTPGLLCLVLNNVVLFLTFVNRMSPNKSTKGKRTVSSDLTPTLLENKVSKVIRLMTFVTEF